MLTAKVTPVVDYPWTACAICGKELSGETSTRTLTLRKSDGTIAGWKIQTVCPQHTANVEKSI